MKRKTYLYEIPLSYLFVYILNHYAFFQSLLENYTSHSHIQALTSFLDSTPLFIDFSPHPYWILILLFASRYGVAPGFLAGLSSAALYLIDSWYFGAQYQFTDAGFYILPSFFVLIGALVGLGVLRKDQKINRLESFVDKQNTTIHGINEGLETQTLINQQLEKRIISKMSTMVTLYQGAQSLESIDLDEILLSIVDFFSRTLQSNQSALYIKQDDSWVLKQSLGWESPDQWPKTYSLNQGMVGIAAAQDRIVSIKDFVGSDLSLLQKDSDGPKNINLQQDCLIAAPLKIGDQGEIIAVFTIQNLPLLSLNSATTNLISFLTNWANRSIDRSFYFKDLKSKEILDPELGIYTSAYFQSRLSQEFSKSKTYYLPLSLILIKAIGLDDLKGQQRRDLKFTLSQLFTQTFQDTDIVATFEDNNIQFACLLTTKDHDKAQEAISLLKTNFDKLNLQIPIQLSIGSSSFTPQVNSQQELIKQAKGQIGHAA